MSGYTVAIVLDPAFGEKLVDVARRFEVWVVPSDENRAAAAACTGSITFWTKRQDWRGMLFDVDLHHGEYSHDPPLSALEVFGAEVSAEARRALAEYGFTSVEPTSFGFRASRDLVAGA